MEKRTNDDIRKEVEVTSDWLLQYVRIQKLAYFGHIVRHDGMEKRVMRLTFLESEVEEGQDVDGTEQ